MRRHTHNELQTAGKSVLLYELGHMVSSYVSNNNFFCLLQTKTNELVNVTSGARADFEFMIIWQIQHIKKHLP